MVRRIPKIVRRLPEMTNVTANTIPAQASMLKQHWGGLVFLLFVVLGIFTLLLRAITWMGDEQRLPFSQIIVQGNLTYLTTEEVKQAVNQISPLYSFMVQDVDDIQAAVLHLPWAENVAVRKQWPDTLKVNITEYKPEAIWNATQLMDANATVFDADPNKVKALGLVSLHGPDGSEKEVLGVWREMRKLLSASGLDIAALALNERKSWRIVTRNGIRIELGRESRNERLQRFLTLFDEINLLDKEVQYADLRYDIGAAIGWKSPDALIEK